jgi:hypothetical protein
MIVTPKGASQRFSKYRGTAEDLHNLRARKRARLGRGSDSESRCVELTRKTDDCGIVRTRQGAVLEVCANWQMI